MSWVIHNGLGYTHSGGPGCSSELAAFYENGPYQVNENLTVKANAYGWDNAGSIIYVDQVCHDAQTICYRRNATVDWLSW